VLSRTERNHLYIRFQNLVLQWECQRLVFAGQKQAAGRKGRYSAALQGEFFLERKDELAMNGFRIDEMCSCFRMKREGLGMYNRLKFMK